MHHIEVEAEGNHRRMALQLRASTCGDALCSIEVDVGLATQRERERKREKERGLSQRRERQRERCGRGVLGATWTLTVSISMVKGLVFHVLGEFQLISQELQKITVLFGPRLLCIALAFSVAQALFRRLWPPRAAPPRPRVPGGSPSSSACSGGGRYAKQQGPNKNCDF